MNQKARLTAAIGFFPDACIEAPLRRDRRGFPRVSLPIQGKHVTFPAHRLAYGLFVAPVKHGEPVRHTCGNPACINPRHLFTAVPPAPTIDDEVRHDQA